MTPIFLIIYLVILLVILITGLTLVSSARTKGSMARALNMSLFLVTLPRLDSNQNQRPEKELIAVMEQLYGSFVNLHASGWNKFLHGEPYIALELSVHHVGEQIHFYMAVPRSFENTFEKQVHGLFPSAEVVKVKDYNIFNPHGVSAGAYFTAKSNPILPFKTYNKLEGDPLGQIANALSKLEKEGEGASVQILIRPSHRDDIRVLAQKVAHEMQGGHDFKKALMLVKNKDKKKEKKEDMDSKTMTAFEEEIIKALQSKASRPLFDVNLRVLVSADNQVRANAILEEITGSFVQFGGPEMNEFEAHPLKGGDLDILTFNYAFRIFDNKHRMHLSSEELTSLYHFPVTSALMPRIRFITSASAEPPANLPSSGVILGENVFRGQKSIIRLAEEDRRRHLYILGQTGTGKSTLLKGMVLQDIQNGKGVCVIDPHGDFAEYALSVVPKERADDVIYFNPADIERPLGLNLLEFDPSKPEQKTFITNEFYSIMKTIYKDLPEAFGPMFEQYYKNSALLLMDDFAHEIPTLAEIPRVLADADYRKDKLSRETNPLVKNFWEQEAEKAGGEAALANMVPYITSKLNPFLANDYIRPIIAQRQSAFNFRDVMDNKKILIANLSKGKLGDLNANLLGLIIVSKLVMAALSRDTSNQNELNDLYLYIDEFQNFTTSGIATILSEARKYRLDLTMAHQFIKQLPDDIRNATFGNVGSMAIFRISAEDAETDVIKNNFSQVFSSQDFVNVPNMNAYAKLLIHGQPTRPFNLRLQTDEIFGAGSPETLKAMQEISRLKFGKPRDEVEAEIRQRYQPQINKKEDVSN